MVEKTILGVDIGASGIKGAIVDIEKGVLHTERLRLDTPKPSTPEAVSETFSALVRHFNWNGIIGCGFPSVIKNGQSLTAANIDKGWVGCEVEKILSDATGCSVKVSNDADVAGIAEMEFGAGKNNKGTVIMITVGSGLGSALFTKGELVPNTEFGHFYLKGHNRVAEQYAADSIRKKESLSWEEWAGRFDEFLHLLEELFAPDLIMLGGGASKKFDRFSHLLTSSIPVKPAELRNHAGIIGAALYASSIQSATKVGSI